ncbi:PilW family protein [Halomonas sp. MA07-2]
MYKKEPGNNTFRYSSGFSLVELMVALLIGLLILLGAGQLFLMSKRSYDQAEMLATRQQAVRSIFDIISLDVRTADRVVDNASNQLVLLLKFAADRREKDPYCPSNEKLKKVQFTFDSSDQALFVSVDCGVTVEGEEITDDPLGKGEGLISGIENMRFVLSDDHYGEDADGEVIFLNDRGLSVELDVTFPSLAGDEEGGRRNFVFKVARRENIM